MKFRKDLEIYLFEAQTVVLPDKQNRQRKAKNFRPDEVFHIGGGITVDILNDGNVVLR